MVCPRCIDTVKDIFERNEAEIAAIQLGEVTLPQALTQSQKNTIEQELKAKGFELLQNASAKLITQIKSTIINAIHHSDTSQKVSFSEQLSQQLNHEYTYLSRLFSSVEGITIEKYIIKQKIERVKELLFYDELTLSEIAFQMEYSSVAHLSAQFKKETGMTPSQFKKIKSPNRQSLDSI